MKKASDSTKNRSGLRLSWAGTWCHHVTAISLLVNVVTGAVEKPDTRRDGLSLEAEATSIDSNSTFVTVDLSSHYHGRFIETDMGDGFAVVEGALPVAGARWSVAGIPFAIGSREQGDHLDVGLARWPDVKDDPVGIYSHYKPRYYGDPECPVVRLPRQDYTALYLLCFSDTDTAKTKTLSLRLGLHDGNGILFDSSVEVPRWNEVGGEQVVGSVPIQMMSTAGKKEGHLFVVRAPLRSGDTQDIAAQSEHLDMELTKELHVAVRNPDPARFRRRPLGRPSAARVIALSLEVSPVQLTVGSVRVGNIFVEPEVPAFNIKLVNVTGRSKKVRVEAVVTDYYGNERVFSGFVPMAPHSPGELHLQVPQEKYGWFSAVFRIFADSRRCLVERRTTFAYMPVDRRRATFKDSPFGTWCFGMTHRGTTIERAGPLMYRAGVRRTLASYGYEDLKKYGLGRGQHGSIVGTHKVGEVDPEALRRTFSQWPDTREALVFHESNIGPLMTHPGFLVGKNPAPLDSASMVELQRRWDGAIAASAVVRRLDPRMSLVFGNMVQPSIEQYLARGYPPEYIDFLGEESPGFMRMPERQPEVAGFSSLWWMKAMARHYGYDDVGLAVSFEWMYHSTNPGNLDERTAANYNVRDCLLALAYRVPKVNPALAYDVGNAYYFSNWGASGLCHRPPELNPKPGYVAYATMTAQLDQARFSRKLDTGSTSVFALEFVGDTGDKIYALWTIRGERQVHLRLAKGYLPVVTDAMGNGAGVSSSAGQVTVVVNSEPRWVTGVEVDAVRSGSWRYTARPGPTAVLLDHLDVAGSRQVSALRDTAFENYTWDVVRRPGRFSWAVVNDSERGMVTRVGLAGPQKGPAVAAYYNFCEFEKSVSLPGIPRQLGLWVYGNSSWGRIVFMLEDANGEQWVHLGAALYGKADWNTNDTESTSFVNFDGWRYLAVELPGEYPHERYQWPRKCNWRAIGGDGLVDYPLKLLGFYVQLRENLVYIDEMVAATSDYLKLADVMCSY